MRLKLQKQNNEKITKATKLNIMKLCIWVRKLPPAYPEWIHAKLKPILDGSINIFYTQNTV